MDPNDHFVALQNSVLARLQAIDASVPAPAAAHGAITWLSEVKGDVASKLAKAIGSLGIVGVVLTPTALMVDPNGEDLGMYAPVLIQIQENVIINQGASGTQIPALRLVSFVMKRLQNFCHNIYNGSPATQRLRLDPKPFVLIKDDAPLTYNVAATAMLDLSAALR